MEQTIDMPLIRTSVPKRESWLTRCYKSICCCRRANSSFSWRPSHIWAKIREKLTRKKRLDNTYKFLLDIYSHKPIDIDMQDCKKFPDFSNTIRDDLEFYIPQLCNFLLYGDPVEAQQLGKVVLSLCQESFYFAHRVIWFINSLNFERLEHPVIDVDYLLTCIQEVSAKNNYIYLSNPQKLRKYLSTDDVSEEQYKETLETIEKYREGECEGNVYAECIPLSPFRNTMNCPFYSTIDFFDRLCALSEELDRAVHKMDYLKDGLNKINSLLPASVYIPFNTEDARNCCVLHIPVSEAFLFSSKEKTPIKLTIEVFSPHKELKASKNLKLHKQASFSLISENSTCTNDALVDFKDLTEASKIPPVNYHFLKQVDEEESFCISYSAVSDGVSAIYNDSEENSVAYQENLIDKEKRLRSNSPFGNLITWQLITLIIKSGEELRQEQLAIQLFTFFKQTFEQQRLDIWLHPYDIIATHRKCGVIECVSDAVSIDQIKKSMLNERSTLLDYFFLHHGNPKSKKFKQAQKEFMKSLAGYSLACFILQIKDRHNGNILIDSAGHIVHIDFGYMLSNSPGGNMKFESAPFKLTEEFERVLGGRRSRLFLNFRALCVKGYIALIEKAEQIILMVEMMRTGSGADFPCFIKGEEAVSQLRKRLLPQKNMTKSACKEYINSLIDDSLDNWSTRWYDRVQYLCQGILY